MNSLDVNPWLAVALLASLLACAPHTASAQIEAFSEETGEVCSEVTIDGHHVEGGCHVEYQGEEHIPVVMHTLVAPVPVFICNWHLDARIGGDGSGLVSEARFTEEVPTTSPNCATRTPCDEATHEMVPWPIQIVETAGLETVELELCARLTSSGEGGAESWCELHLPFVDSIQHAYAIGDHGESFCETSPIQYPVSIRDVRLVGETAPEAGTEDMEIIH